VTIDHGNLTSIDLNLLVALDALLTEQGVTRAANRLGLKQSAMSSNLGRIRRLLDDEILTRSGDGMHLTPRAMALVGPVRTALRQIQCIVNRGEAFDPNVAERTFGIALPGSMEALLGPRLLSLVASEAPNVRIVLQSLDYGQVLPNIDADRIDIAVGVFDSGQMHHKVRPLYRDGYLCLFNETLLKVSAPLSLDDYLRHPHVMTTLNGTGPGVVDEALTRIGRQRRLLATTPRFATVPFLVQASPVLTTMVAALATRFAGMMNLATSPVPVELMDFTVSMLWHSSYDHDPAHRWLRDLLLRASRRPAGPG
jgi:LysR family transcriptional regulator, mexEF-oprN operon transcriptional activator